MTPKDFEQKWGRVFYDFWWEVVGNPILRYRSPLWISRDGATWEMV